MIVLRTFLEVIAVLRAAFGFYKKIRAAQEADRKAAQEGKRQRLEQALKDAKAATTEEDAFAAQEKIVDNSN